MRAGPTKAVLIAAAFLFAFPGPGAFAAAPMPESLPAFQHASQERVAPAVLSRAAEIEALWQDSPKKAHRAIRQWMKEEKSSPYPWVVQASLRYREKRYKKCLALGNKALTKDPHSADAYYWRARAFEAQGKPLEAANEYQTALAAQESFAQAKAGLDRAVAALGSPTGTP